MRRLLLLLVLALAALGLWSIARPRPPRPSPAASAPEAPAGGKATAAARRAVVPIQDGKTIDFSSGKPVVKDNAAERATIDQAVKDMDAAAAGVTFGPKPESAGATGK